MRKINKFCSLLFILGFFILGEIASAQVSPLLTQVSVIDSLLGGDYDGWMTLKELRSYGNFGLGTIDRIDGELIILDGVFYVWKSNGTIKVPSAETTVPLASIVNFVPEIKVPLPENLDFDDVSELIRQKIPNENIPVAIHIQGTFTNIRTRSAYCQEKPYRPLAEVMKTQPEFELGTVEGDIVGFYLPGFVKGINVPGVHFHFISSDRQQGGHLMTFQTKSGTISFCPIYQFQILLPQTDNNIDLNKDRSAELYQVEGGNH
ncbi:MAG: acetolactate decarboxylase [Planctomycetia bacterium]|nr:acetolactate decarboxylase [Planctomycetia bacterium]